jgi:polyhydroxyalkanoate synthase
MEDYVLNFIAESVRRVQEDSGVDDVTVIGYCFGGVLSLLYGSIFHGPTKNLICFTTPIDFREMKLFNNFSDRRYFDVDRLVDSVRNVPPELILQSFEMLRPASRAASQVQCSCGRTSGTTSLSNPSGCSTAGQPTSYPWQANISAPLPKT